MQGTIFLSISLEQEQAMDSKGQFPCWFCFVLLESAAETECKWLQTAQGLLKVKKHCDHLSYANLGLILCCVWRLELGAWDWFFQVNLESAAQGRISSHLLRSLVLLRKDLESAFDDDLDSIFDISNMRSSLGKQKQDTEIELKWVTFISMLNG